MNGVISARGKTNAALEPALRKLEAVYDRSLDLLRIGPNPRNEQLALTDERLDLAEVDPWQGDEHEHRTFGLEDVHRRFPSDRRGGAGQLEKLPMHSLRAR